jgi:ClpP class serine protease
LSLIEIITNSHWAITDEALQSLAAFAEANGDINSLEKNRGERPHNTENASIRNGVATIPVRGPLFKRSDFFTDYFGLTTYESVLRDFHQMIESPDVKSIVFDIDSPGGMASGISELSDHIHATRGKKPIAAYVGGYGASAAYFLASACDRVYASDDAIVGSIGTQTTVYTRKEDGRLTFRSAQSPNKNPDPATDEGKKATQSITDALAEIFVQKVARNRGISRETVMENYGQGAVFVGEKARTQGLVDEISTLEGVIAKLGEKPVTTPVITTAYIAEKHPEIAQHFMNLGTAATIEKLEAEQKRIESIRASAKGLVSDEFCHGLIESGVSASDAMAAIIREAQKNPPKAKSDSRAETDAGLAGLNTPPIESSPAGGDEKKTLDTGMDTILALLHQTEGLKVRGLK